MLIDHDTTYQHTKRLISYYISVDLKQQKKLITVHDQS